MTVQDNPSWLLLHRRSSSTVDLPFWIDREYRAVCDVLGIQDVVAKSVGSANPHNVVKASVAALLSQASPKLLSAMRGKKISEIISKRENTKWN